MSDLPLIPLSKIPNFDPRKVPSLGADAHLPPVEPARLTPQALRARFLAPPVWEPELREEPRFTEGVLRPAAVLIPIVLRDEPTVLLTERSLRLANHSGQISFPGGRIDPGDVDAADAALREAEEEVALPRSFVEVLGHLSGYVTVTAYAVTPVVALVRPGFTLVPNPQEVATAFEVPLAFLMNPANHHHHAFAWEGQHRAWIAMPYQSDTGERFIWGATAAMLRNFYRFLCA